LTVSPFDFNPSMSSGSAKNVRSRFAEIVSREDAAINLAEAALLIAAEEYPRLDVELYLERLDYFADLARERAAESVNAIDVITALNATLFEELGFRGNRENYYDPRNSYLNEVIDRRTGIPITLTVVVASAIHPATAIVPPTPVPVIFSEAKVPTASSAALGAEVPPKRN